MTHILVATANRNSLHPNRETYAINGDLVTVTTHYCDDDHVRTMTRADARARYAKFRRMWAAIPR